MLLLALKLELVTENSAKRVLKTGLNECFWNLKE